MAGNGKAGQSGHGERSAFRETRVQPASEDVAPGEPMVFLECEAISHSGDVVDHRPHSVGPCREAWGHLRWLLQVGVEQLANDGLGPLGGVHHLRVPV